METPTSKVKLPSEARWTELEGQRCGSFLSTALQDIAPNDIQRRGCNLKGSPLACQIGNPVLEREHEEQE